MSSTTFKSATGGDSELDVRANDCGVFIALSRGGQIRQASTFAASDAPALALAVLEAAGWPNEYLATTEILRRLRELDEHAKAVEAEARERAELEAEALELLNAHRGATGNPLAESLDGLLYNAKEKWLAVARRAREMRAEK